MSNMRNETSSTCTNLVWTKYAEIRTQKLYKKMPRDRRRRSSNEYMHRYTYTPVAGQIRHINIDQMFMRERIWLLGIARARRFLHFNQNVFLDKIVIIHYFRSNKQSCHSPIHLFIFSAPKVHNSFRLINLRKCYDNKAIVCKSHEA